VSRPHVSGDSLRIDTFLNDVRDGKITDARPLDADGYIVGTYTRADGSTAAYNAPYLKSDTALAQIQRVLTGSQVPTTIDQQNDKRVAQYASQLLPPLMMVVLFGYLLLSYRTQSGVFSVRSGARKGTSSRQKVSFADVAGQAEAVAELRDIGQYLR